MPEDITANEMDFKELAHQFILLDEGDASAREAHMIVKKVASAIEVDDPIASRVAVSKWISSIGGWMPGSDMDDQTTDNHMVERAKALDFVASTLVLLKKGTLKCDQVGILVKFFTTMYSNDHRAGVLASTKALLHLQSMDAFQPCSGASVLCDLPKLGDDFPRQLSSTRDKIYELVHVLVMNRKVADELDKQQQGDCRFMLALVNLFQQERDPKCLKKWFQILTVFLKMYNPKDDIVKEVTRTFFAYFPVTIRATVSPSGVTADDLRVELRSSLAAHDCLARWAIPFLLKKLDEGEAVTAVVKMDILATLNACIAGYEDVQKCIVPHARKIWTSLKYEVRNGEAQDIIQPTLKTIGTLVSRMDNEAFEAIFLDTVWPDLREDLAEAKHTLSAGQLLVTIAGANARSFSLVSSHSVKYLSDTLRDHQRQDMSYKADLLTVLNSHLPLRSELAKESRNVELLEDILFRSLYLSTYMPIWSHASTSDDDNSTRKMTVLRRLMQGMASLALQRSQDQEPLLSDTYSGQIIGILSKPAIIDPLLGVVSSAALRRPALEALAGVMDHHPVEFRRLLIQMRSFLLTLPPTCLNEDSLTFLFQGLAIIGCAKPVAVAGVSPIANCVCQINMMLAALVDLPPKAEYWRATILSIDFVFSKCRDFLDAIRQSRQGAEVTADGQFDEAVNFCVWYKQITEKLIGLPEVDVGQPGDLQQVSCCLDKQLASELPVDKQFQAFSIFVVGQLYRRFTVMGWGTDICRLSEDAAMQHSDAYLCRLGKMATGILRQLSQEEQSGLGLWKEIFLLFRKDVHFPVDQPCEVSRGDAYRTVPLALGVVHSLWPAAMLELDQMGTLSSVFRTLTAPSLVECTARALMDAMLCGLANKGEQFDLGRWERLMRLTAETYETGILNSPKLEDENDQTPADDDSLAVFRSLLHLLAGDLARYRKPLVLAGFPYPGLPGPAAGSGPADTSGPAGSSGPVVAAVASAISGARTGKTTGANIFTQEVGANSLVSFIAKTAPGHARMGRQMARDLGILADPGCLNKENHYILRNLRGQWVYRHTVEQCLPKCFPSTANDASAEELAICSNYAVAVFAVLNRLESVHYSGETEHLQQIVRVIVRSMATFQDVKDMISCLRVLNTVLVNDVTLVKEHVTALIKHTIDAYHMAGSLLDSSSHTTYAGAAEANVALRNKAGLCRKLVLQFLHTLAVAGSSAKFLLLPSQPDVLRLLFVACGDAFRETRSLAQKTKHLWEDMD